MALIIGDQTADTGMSKAIYDQLQSMLEPDLGDLSDEVRSQLRANWQKLAYAIARGVIEHILAHMEVTGIQTEGNIDASVQGNTSLVSGHQHGINLAGVQNDLVFTQSHDGTGHIK